MPTTVIPEQAVGEGDFLVFPGVSSCLAIIGVTTNSLIGAHKTTGLDATLVNLRDYMGDRLFRSLYLVGWILRHDPNQIKREFGRNVRTYAYDIARKEHKDVCLTAQFVNLNSRPIIGFAKTTAVTVKGSTLQTRRRVAIPGVGEDGWPPSRLETASGGQFDAKSVHKLKKHYVLI